MPIGMRNSSAGSRYSATYSLRRGYGTIAIMFSADADLPVNVQFSLLGPVRAWRGPAELDLGPNQQRAVLALLLVRANQLVTIDDLIDLLWEQNPPGSAINVIYKYIGAIR